MLWVIAYCYSNYAVEKNFVRLDRGMTTFIASQQHGKFYLIPGGQKQPIKGQKIDKFRSYVIFPNSGCI